MFLDKNKRSGIIGTTIIHIVVLLVLLFVFIQRPEIQAEGGVPVMLGNVDMAAGDADPYMMTDIDILNQGLTDMEVASEPDYDDPSIPDVEDLITQEDEPTVEMPAVKEKPVKVQPKEVTPKKSETTKVVEKSKPTEQLKHEMSEAEKRAEAEKAAAEARAAQERAAAEQAAQRIAGAFGKGTKMGSRGDGESGEGIQGSATGNSNIGKTSGIGGRGVVDLEGRSLGEGGLPMPVYNVQEEGRVVVTITVNPQGQVIRTSINKRTNTVNASLRKAAEEAARKARFNAVNGVNDQTGTITYYFRLK
jgi:TonB family protein